MTTFFAQKRNKRKLSWLNNGREEDKEEHDVIRREYKKLVRKTKRTWMEGKIKEIKAENRKNNMKLFYKKVGENNKAYNGKVKGIKNKEGRITKLEQEYKQIWKEYFENLLTDCETILQVKMS